MSCPLTLSAYKKGCKSSAGVKSVYIVDHEARVNSAIAFNIELGVLTISGTAAVDAYHILPVDRNITVTNPITASEENNSFKFDRVVELALDGYNATMAVLVENIVKGRTEMLVEWVNGTYTYVGNYAGMSVTGGDGGRTGTNLDDPKGITLTLTEQATSPMPIAVFSEFDAAFTIVEPS